MYILYMSEMAVSEARAKLADVVDEARSEGPVFLSRRGRRVAAVIGIEQYEDLVAHAEDAADVAAAAAARAELDAGAETVPWDEVKRDLGLA